MKQSEAFLDGEGHRWLLRNWKKLPPKHDPVLETLEVYKVAPRHALEIGCANGWRLRALMDKYGCRADGVDPGCPGIKSLANNLCIWRGTADSLPVKQQFDLVIYGFCLYLCDPEDLFRIAAEGDRALEEHGHLVIYDFTALAPQKVPYKHKKDVYSHKMPFENLWLAHPAYSLLGRQIYPVEETSVTILRKNMQTAFPVR